MKQFPRIVNCYKPFTIVEPEYAFVIFYHLRIEKRNQRNPFLVADRKSVAFL